MAAPTFQRYPFCLPIFTQDYLQYWSPKHITDGQAGFNWLVFIGAVRRKRQQMFVSFCHVRSHFLSILCVIFFSFFVNRTLNLEYTKTRHFQIDFLGVGHCILPSYSRQGTLFLAPCFPRRFWRLDSHWPSTLLPHLVLLLFFAVTVDISHMTAVMYRVQFSRHLFIHLTSRSYKEYTINTFKSEEKGKI